MSAIEDYVNDLKYEMRRCLKNWKWNREETPDITTIWEPGGLRELFYSSWLETPEPESDEIDWEKYSNELNTYAAEVCKEFKEMVRKIKIRESRE